MHEVLVNRLGGLSLPRKSVVMLTDRPAMTLDVCRGRKTAMQQQSMVSLIIQVISTLIKLIIFNLLRNDFSLTYDDSVEKRNTELK